MMYFLTCFIYCLDLFSRTTWLYAGQLQSSFKIQRLDIDKYPGLFICF